LKRAQWSNDPAKLVAAVANYTFGSSFSYHAPHLKGEEVFGFVERLVDCPLGEDNDYRCLDHVNFSHPQVIVHVIPILLGM
jgi:hypothetical protein